MAVVLLTRIAIVLAPLGVRAIQVASGPGAAKITAFSTSLWHRLTDGLESDEALSAAASDEVGSMVVVTTFAEPFEVRRAQVSWEVDAGALSKEDVRVCTFHVLKLTGGVPDATWVAGNFDTVKNALQTFWIAIRPWFPGEMVMTSIKFYREGPDLSPPQPPVFSQTYTDAASSVAASLPAQVAMAVTERAGDKLHWGRFYLPAPAVSKVGPVDTLTDKGRWSSGFMADVGVAAEALYETCTAAGLPIVVYRAPLPVRQTAAEKRAGTVPGSLAARPGSAWTVTDLQLDDVPDIIRSRRVDAPLVRTVRPISGS